MAHRPTYINVHGGTGSGANSGQNSPASSGFPSPRIPRVAGEVAPAMSPLDMFAAQSRALARQLDESRKNDRRVSRLPPLAVVDGLAKKPAIFHQGPASASDDRSGQEKEDYTPSPDDGTRGKMAIESPVFRPKSVYPRFSKVAAPSDSFLAPGSSISEEEMFQTPMEFSGGSPKDYFAGSRPRSPDSNQPVRPSMESLSQQSSYSSVSRPKQSLDSVKRNSDLVRGLSIESTSSRMSQYSRSLQPPNPPYARKSPSIRSVDSDDDNPGITPSSSISQHRKLSSSSNTSLPLSPQYPYSNYSHNRSTSGISEYSVGGNRLSRPAYNFSRPMSRNSRPSVDSPSRLSSSDSHMRIYGDDEQQAPLSGENYLSADPESFSGPKEGEVPGANSYIYAKFSLPRGRMVQRDSLPLDAMVPNFEWEQPKVPTNVEPINSTVSTPVPFAPLPTPPHSIESERAARVSTESLPNRPPPIGGNLKDQHRHSMNSMNTTNTGNSGSTIKAPQRNRPSSQEMTAEDHLNKGIECHERGSLKESTYHLRLAARQNNPTAMLLYALACRHGWGMRESPSEGVIWLRKAMDCASIELSNSDGQNSTGAAAGAAAANNNPEAAQSLKARRAQFALSVYELGVSHMNGWGIEQDKSLALRCFEIASSWGDADAMAEAGFCYAQGVGCKKDLKKAAKYYRDAEAKGMSMVGNSWIYKSKYADKTADKKEERERTGRHGNSGNGGEHPDGAGGGDGKKQRDKSRTRSLFGRKKSAAA